MKMQLIKSLPKAVLALVICLFLASCGSGCYEDPNFSDPLSYIPRTKSFSIDPRDKEWVDTGIDIFIPETDDTGNHKAEASITVEGTLSLCQTKNSPHPLKYVTMCTKLQSREGAPYLTSICNNSTPGEYARCFAQAEGSDISFGIRELPCSAAQENFVCDNGTLYKPNGKGSWETDKTQCAFDSFCKECMTGSLFCDNGKLSYIYPTLSQENTGHTTILIPGASCAPTITEYKISASQPAWTHITDDQGIKPGDIVKLSIMKPQDPPPVLTKTRTNVPVDNDKKISWNTYTFDINRYWDWAQEASDRQKQDCPEQIAYNTNISQKCAFNASGYSSCSTFPYDNSRLVSCLWLTFGTGLKLASNDTCNSSQMDSKETLVDFTDSSTSPYGEYIPIIDPSNENILGGGRTFVPEHAINKLCAAIYNQTSPDGKIKHEDSAGGYILQAEIQSCVALDGHPSPALPSQPTLGALMYMFSTQTPEVNDAGSAIFKDTKFYDPRNTSPTTSTATIYNDTRFSRLYLKISVPEKDRAISTGFYTVTVTYKEYPIRVGISSSIDYIKNFIKQIMFGEGSNEGSLQTYFNELKKNVNYSRYITILLVLYIVLYGLSFLTGNTQISQSDLLIHVIKIGIVIALISDTSWNFFHDHFFQIFINGTDALIRMFGIEGCDKGTCPTFYFVDHTLILLLATPSTLLKMLALIFMSPLGIIIVMLVLIGVFYFLLGVLSAIVSYLLCVMAIAILISLAPIFIPFALFDFTQYLFEQWWKMLARYALEPVLLIFGLQILVQIFYVTLIQLLDFTVCWKCVWPFNFDFSPVGGLLDAANISKTLCIPFFGAFGIFPDGGGASFLGQFSGSLASGLILIIIALVIREYTSFVNNIMDNIIGQSPGADYSDSKGKKQDRDAGKFLRDKIGVSRFENYVTSKARDGVTAITGFSLKTDDEIKKEKDYKQAKEKEEDEKYKRQGMRMLSGGKIDLDAQNLDKAFERTEDQKSLEALKSSDSSIKNAAATKLGEQMFANLAKDKYSAAAFEKGLTKLASLDSAKLDKLPQASQLKDLQVLLQKESIKPYMTDLKKSDDAVRKAAQLQIGKAMYSDANVGKSLSDRQARSTIVSELLKLARESD
jgi:type IV secretory pathway VirB6-like protein